jgi:DDE superfamily endonuclease
MRLPIVELPHIVSDNLAHFARVFATREQQKHFGEYVTGLIAGDKATVSAINDLFLDQNDQSALNKFLTQASWDENELNRRRLQLEITRLQRRPLSAQAGRLIIDDTFAHHTKCSMEGLAYLRDRHLGHNVWAHDVVTSYYVNRSDQFPVDLRLYFQFNLKHEQQVLEQKVAQLEAAPTLANYRQYLTTLLSYHYRQQLYQAKTELGAQLVTAAAASGVPFAVVLFDNWFLRLPLVQAIEEAHKDWVGGCPKDRLVLYQNHWTQVQEFIRTIPASAYRPYRIGNHLFWVFSLVMPMKNLHRRRVRILAVYEDEVKIEQTPLFFATNRTDWEAKRILTTYLDRWPTETFNQDIKGNLGFEAYQLRRVRAIRRHWYLCFVAYSLLGDQGPPGHSRWNVRGQFQSTGQRCQAVVDELLTHLVAWIARQLEQGVSTQKLLQLLLT